MGAGGDPLFTQTNNLIYPFPVVNRSLALGSTTFDPGDNPSTTSTTSALILLDGNTGDVKISNGDFYDLSTSAVSSTNLCINTVTGKIGQCTSDVRLKTNINTITGSALELMNKLRPVTFDFINGAKSESGFIAQEVQKIIPNLVRENPIDGLLTFSSDSLVPYLVRAIQEMSHVFTSQKIISPIAEVETVKTNIISPLSKDSLTIRLPEKTASLVVTNSDDEPVISFSEKGNMTAESIKTKDATVSGALMADRIITTYGDVEERIASITATLAESFKKDDLVATPVASIQSIPDFSPELPATTAALVADLFRGPHESSSHIDLSGRKLHLDTMFLNNNLSVVGGAVLGETMIAGSLMVDGAIRMTSDGIETIGEPLYLQKLKLADFDVMNGAFVIDTNGNVKFSGNVAIAGTLSATTLKPMKGNDLTLDLAHVEFKEATQSATPSATFGNLVVKGTDGTAVAIFSPDGTASVSGTLSARELTSKKFIVETDQNSINSAQKASAGESVIPRGSKEVVIQTDKVSDKSLIFLTPTVATDKTLSVTHKEQGSFTVEITSSTLTDIAFNWWVIN